MKHLRCCPHRRSRPYSRSRLHSGPRSRPRPSGRPGRIETAPSNARKASSLSMAILLLVSMLFNLTAAPGITGTGESGIPTDTGGTSTGGKPVYENSGDWIIENGDSVSRTGEHIIVNGDLIIEEGGSLVLRDCDLRMNATEDAGYGIVVYGSMEAVGCSILSASPYAYTFVARGHLHLNQTRVEDAWGSGKPYVGGIQCYSDDILVEACVIANNTQAGIFAGADITVRNTEFYGNRIAVSVNNGSSPVFYNPYFHNQKTRDVYVKNSSLPRFVNAVRSFTKQIDDDTSGAAISWYLSIYVTFADGTPVGGVNVHVEDTYTGTQKRDLVTDGNGTIMNLQLLEKIVREEGKRDDVFSNYRIDIEKFGLENSMILYDFEESMSVTMVLTGDRFGSNPAAGDFNADGFMDIAVSAPGNLTGGEDSGAVFVFLGDASTPFMDLGESDADITLFGDTGEEFGAALGSGDINGDGYDDLIIGAPGNDAGGLDSGAAYLFYGKDSLSVGDWKDETEGPRAAITLRGREPDTALGVHIDASGDFNDDGYDDMVIGSATGLHIYYGSDTFVEDFSSARGGTAKVKAKGPGDNTGEPLSDIKNNDASSWNDPGYYRVDPPNDGGNVMNFRGFDTSDMFGSVVGVTLKVAYQTDRYYGYYENERSWIQWRIGEGDWQNSIRPTQHRNSEYTETYNLFAEGVDTLEEIENLEIYFENKDGTGGGSQKHYIRFDYVWIIVTAEPTFANITLTDYARSAGMVASGDVDNDGYDDLLMPVTDGYRLYYGSGSGLPLFSSEQREDFTFVEERDNVTISDGTVSLSRPHLPVEIVSNGRFDDELEGWQWLDNTWTDDNGDDDKNAARPPRIIDEGNKVADWWALEGPTGSFGSDYDTISNSGNNNNAKKLSDGRFVSETFEIGPDNSTIHFRYHFKAGSFESSGGSQNVGDQIKYELWEMVGDVIDGDDHRLETFIHMDGSGGVYEEDGHVIFDASEHVGKTVYVSMEINSNAGRNDNALAQIDELYALEDVYFEYGNLTSGVYSYERNITQVRANMDYEDLDGSIELRVRTDSSLPWENATLLTSGEFQDIPDLPGSDEKHLQYRISISRGPGENLTPLVEGLEFEFHFEGYRTPVEITGNYTAASMGDFNGDGFTDVGLASLSERTVYLFHGRSDPPVTMGAGDANITITGSGDFGYSLSFVRDIDQDGMEEFLVGMPSDDEGKVLLFRGRAGDHAMAPGDADGTYPGEFPGDRYGEFLQGNIVTTPFHDINRGRIYFLPVHLHDAGIVGIDMETAVWPGENTTVSCILGNYGTENLSGVNISLVITSQDNLSYEYSAERAADLSSLGSFGTREERFSWDVPAGEGVRYSVAFSIDYPSDLNPLNNVTVLDVMTRYHGVGVSSPIEGNASHAGDPVTFPLTVVNTGTMGNDTISLEVVDATVPDGWQARFLLDGSPVTDVTLAPGESAQANLEIVSPASEENGTFPISSNFTSENGVARAVLMVNVTVLRPDLAVTGLDIFREDGTKIDNTDVHGVARENLTLEATIRNLGDTYSDPFDIIFFTDNGTLGSVPHGRLEAGENETVRIRVRFGDDDVGTFNISCQVDPSSGIYELSEDNNNRDSPIDLWDNIPGQSINLLGYLLDLNGDPVTNGSIHVENVRQGNFYDNDTGEDGHYGIIVPADEFRDGDKFKLSATNGIFSTTEFFYLYSEDGGEYWLNLTLREYRTSLSSPDNRESAAPGETVNYTIIMENRGSTQAVYELHIHDVPSGWGASLVHPSLEGDAVSGYHISLDTGENVQMALSVTLSSRMAEAPAGTMGNISVEAISEDFPFVRDSLSTQTAVLPVSSITLGSAVTEMTGKLGETLEFRITAGNTGNLDEHLIPAVKSTPAHDNNIRMGGFTDYLDLPVNTTREFTIFFKVPAAVDAGSSIDLEITSLRGDSNALHLEVVVEESSSVELRDQAGEFGRSAAPGENVTFHLSLRNTGNRPEEETFHLNITNIMDVTNAMDTTNAMGITNAMDTTTALGGGTETYIDPPVITLAGYGKPGSTGDVDISVVPGLGLPAGTEVILTLEIRSELDTGFLEHRNLTIEIEGHHLVLLSLKEEAPVVEAHPLYSLFHYTLDVDNVGNLPAEVGFLVEGSETGWVERPPVVRLDEFSSTEVPLPVRIPTTSGPGDHADITITPYIAGEGIISQGALSLRLGAGDELRGLVMTLLENRTLSPTHALYRIRLANMGSIYECVEFSASHTTHTTGWSAFYTESTLTLAPGESIVVEVTVNRPTNPEKWDGVLLASLGTAYSGTPVLSLELPKQPLGRITPTLEPPYGSLEEIPLSGSTSTGHIAYYIWDMGDGTVISGEDREEIVHGYARSGNYTITLRSVDVSGLYDDQTLSITVLNEEPQAAIRVVQGNTSIYEGTVLRFSANDSLDVDGDVVGYTWYRDSQRIATTEWVEYRFTYPDIYTVSLVVEDNMGARSSTETETIRVLPKPSESGKPADSGDGDNDSMLFVWNLVGLVILVLLIIYAVLLVRRGSRDETIEMMEPVEVDMAQIEAVLAGKIPPEKVPDSGTHAGEAMDGKEGMRKMHAGKAMDGKEGIRKTHAGKAMDEKEGIRKMPAGKAMDGKEGMRKMPAGKAMDGKEGMRKMPAGKKSSRKRGVRCSACRTLIVIKDGSETLECPGCGKKFRIKLPADNTPAGERSSNKKGIRCTACKTLIVVEKGADVMQCPGCGKKFRVKPPANG